MQWVPGATAIFVLFPPPPAPFCALLIGWSHHPTYIFLPIPCFRLDSHLRIKMQWMLGVTVLFAHTPICSVRY